MENSTGSDQAILFYNRIVELLLQETMVIRKTFNKWITSEERNIIIQALEDLKCYPKGRNDDRQINIVRSVVHEKINNRITVYANPTYYAQLKGPALNMWLHSRTYQSA